MEPHAEPPVAQALSTGPAKPAFAGAALAGPAPTQPPLWWRQWQAPAPAGPTLVIGVVLLTLFAGATLLARPGLQYAAIGVAVAVLALRAARSAEPTPGVRAAARWRTGFVLLSAALICSLAIRDSGVMTGIVVIAALGVAAYAGLINPRPVGVLVAPIFASVAACRGLAWLARAARPRAPLPNVGPVLRGSALLVALLLVVGALLASADSAYAGLLTQLLPTDVEFSPGRLVVAALVAWIAAGVLFNAASPPALAPARARAPRARIEWLLPMAGLIVLLGSFFVVQAAVLFDAYPSDLVSGDLTPAARARQGFGQLVAVTLVLASVLAWASSRVAAADRRLLIGLGAVLVVLLETLVISALRRMFLYEDAFGWSVLRLDVAVFEVWLGVMVVGASALWLLGRGRLVTPVVVGSAGLGILLLALVGPDAVVARASLARYAQTGQIDAQYLRGLGPDATPILAQLPPPVANCALGGTSQVPDPWYATNVSRVHASRVLAEADLPEATCP